MKVLLDINIVLDLFLNRHPFVNEAAAIWQANTNKQIEIFVSAVTPPTIYYITGKASDKTTARQVVQKLLASVGIATIDYAVLVNAEEQPLDDYEDAVQVAAAQAGQMDAIVTRDLRDYQNCPLPVYSPSDFLALI